MAQQILQASKLTLFEVEEKFHLQQIEDAQFFYEWQENLPEVSDREKQRLDEVRSHYRYLSKQPMLEVMVKMVVLSPLLELAGFYEAPFFTKAEESISISTEDDGEVIRGQIDLLALQDKFWIAAIESKQVQYDVMVGLPQILTYMMASSNPEPAIYGLISNGGRFVFIKLLRENPPKYDLSRTYSLIDPGNALYDVLQILKRFGQLTISNSTNGKVIT
jgi:hypothetical protein